MANANRCSASQVAATPATFRSHETMAPIITGSATATFPTRAFSQPARDFSCFFTHSAAPGLVGLGAGIKPRPPSVFWIANTTVEIIKPKAVRSDAIVTPCSRNNVRKRSAYVVSSFKIRVTVSRMRLICDLRASRFTEAAFNRVARSSCRRLRSCSMRLFFAGSAAASSPSSSCSALAMSATSWCNFARLSTSALR